MIQAELKVLGGKYQGKSIPLSTKKFLVGREQDCQLRPNSDLVSRHHCVFVVDEYGVRLRDLGSTNGTRVNGELIRTERALQDGDKVIIGKLELEVVLRKVAAVTATAPAPAVAASVGGPANLPAGDESPSSDDSGSNFELTATASSGETMFEMPALNPGEATPQPGSPTADTAIFAASGIPTPPAGYPIYPGYPPQMPGYPGYAMPGYPPGMMPGYPGYGVPGYPPGMMPGYPMAPQMPQQQMPAAPPPPAGNSNASLGSQAAAAGFSMPTKLPPPEETGVKAPPPPPPPAPVVEGQAPPPVADNQKSTTSAEDIIKKYMQRRSTSKN